MGQSSLDSLACLIMKMFVVLALAAVAFAEPEADPAVVYTTPNYASPLLRYLSYPYTKPVATYSTYNGFYPNPVFHSIGKREAEAEPAVVYHAGVNPLTGYSVPVTTYSNVKSVVSPVTYTTGSHVVSPVTYTTGSKVVSPFTYTTGSNVVSPVFHPLTYNAVAPATHKITNYNSPNHYTAESFGAFGPKYIAKNHGVEHVVKREAEPFVTFNGVSPYTGYPHYVPVMYSGVPVVKAAGADHAVALTPFGVTHSSNVKVCTNNSGEQVPC